MPVKVNALDHLVINVNDVASSAQWYAKILGMEIRVFDPGAGKTRRTSLVFGNQKINVRPKNADKVEWFTCDHEAAGSDDLCFLTSSTPDEVVAHLTANGVENRGRPEQKAGRARHHPVGLLPGSRRQPDRDFVVREVAFVIARSAATKQSIRPLKERLDCFASLAMTSTAHLPRAA